MRHLFFILAFSTLFLSTQPLWEMACKSLFENCCYSTCDADAFETHELCVPMDDATNQCCPPFQCCFIAFAGFSTPYFLDLADLYLKKNSPSEKTDVLFSHYCYDCFRPPDADFPIS